MVKPAFLHKHRPQVLKAVLVLMFPAMLGTCTDPALLRYDEDLPFNFHPIEFGKAYRSAQPSKEELQNAIDLFDIRTVVNLRGPNPGEVWYDVEADVCQQLGVVLTDHRMSARSLPEPELLEAIIHTLLTADYPILIHCQGGADRTGAIAALYRMRIAGDEKDVALDELSPRFFHFRFATPCMDTLAEIYEPADDWLTTYAEEFDQLTCDLN